MAKAASNNALVTSNASTSSAPASLVQSKLPFPWNDVSLYKTETLGEYSNAKAEYTGVGAVHSVHPAVVGLTDLYPPFVSSVCRQELAMPVHPACFCGPLTAGVDELMQQARELDFGLDRYMRLPFVFLYVAVYMHAGRPLVLSSPTV